MNTTVNELYDFGTVLRRKLLNNNLYAHYLSDAMRRDREAEEIKAILLQGNLIAVLM